MRRLGVLAAGCGAFAATAPLGTPAAIAQTTYTTNIVYVSHDTLDRAQSKLACDSAQSTTNCHLYVMNTDGAGGPVTTGNANDLDPVFSPDGTRIAFARSVGGPQGQYDIYVMNSNGTNVTQLTSESKDDRYPAWSPDGTKIAFRGYPAVGGAAIFTMNPDGTGQTAIKNTGGGDQPTWSPDGTRVAYSGTYTNGTDPVSGLPIIADDIFVQPVNATNTDRPTNLTNDPQMSDRYPNWQPTPGSTQILYRRVENSGRELWRVDAATGAPGPVTVPQTGNKGRAATWSPDGKSAAFVSYVDAEGDLEIWMGNVVGNSITAARQLTSNAITDDEPKMANVPVVSSAVPPPAPTPPATGTGGPVGGGAVSGGGVVSNGGTTITVGGGTLPNGKKALSLALTAPKQSLGRRKSLRAYTRCNAKCSVNVTGLTKMKVGGKTRTLRLFRVKKTIKANVRVPLSLRIPTSTLRSVRSALRRRKPVTFTISATARTAKGEFTPTAIRTLTLRR
jgi:TolB protein